ncbi:MAG: PBSX family phage terminase large subunit, partial [Clostridia bacterium]|nr:PBSX family phage terminase large subunit [Clostridia bacterium]
KQEEIIRLLKNHRLKRINILEGAVRSGKTFISLILFALVVAEAPLNATFLMAGRTLNTLERNVLELLQNMVGEKNFTFSIAKKSGTLFRHRVYFEGAGDGGAEAKIRGMTLSGAYLDEATLLPETFFSMLLSRLSTEGAKLIATTNPDSPRHWLKRKYIDRKDLNLQTVRFHIEDNIFLPESYIEDLKKEYTGLFYKRFIEGEWVMASGLVYPMFREARHIKDLPEREDCPYYISVDYGTLNPCSMGLWQVVGGAAHRVNEFYHDGRGTSCLKTDEEYYEALETLAGDRPIQQVIVDPSAASFIEVIRRKGRFSVRKADNKVLDGIRRVSSLLEQGKLTFSPQCAAIAEEFGAYAWDEESPTDAVVQASDHAMDDMRYFVNTIMTRSLV